jgi:hypothetical protein
LLLLVVENGIEELKDELLLFTREEFDLLELSLELRSRSGLTFGGVRLASEEFGDRDFESGGGGAFDEIECRILRRKLLTTT